MKTKLSLVLAILMVASVFVFASCAKVEPINLKITVSESSNAENKEVQKVFNKIVDNIDYAYTSSTPSIYDLLTKMEADGKVKLVSENDGESIKIKGINDLTAKTEEKDKSNEVYEWKLYINEKEVNEKDVLNSSAAFKTGDVIEFRYIHWSLDK